MYFTDDSLLPENQAPLMITAAPYGPIWMPVDCTPEQKLPVTWDEQVQAAVDCLTPVRRSCTSMCVIQKPGTFRKISNNTTNSSDACAKRCRR